MGWGRGLDWIDLAQGTKRRQALVNAVMNLQVPWNVGNFLTGWVSVSFSEGLGSMELVSWLVSWFCFFWSQIAGHIAMVEGPYFATHWYTQYIPMKLCKEATFWLLDKIFYPCLEAKPLELHCDQLVACHDRIHLLQDNLLLTYRSTFFLA